MGAANLHENDLDLAQHNINKVKEVKYESCLPSEVNPECEDYDDPLQQFTFALRAPETKRQYPRRLKVFMDFVRFEDV